MPLSIRPITGAMTLIVATVSCTTYANMGTIGNTYGLFPQDVATTQALSMFNQEVSATYYNPARLVKDGRGELSTGLLQAEAKLEAAGPDRSGGLLSRTPTASLLLGLKTDLSKLTTFDHPMYLGVVLGVENYGFSLLEFQSETSEGGQFLEYDRQPLFVSVGGGTELFRGVSGGLSARATLNNNAALSTTTDLAGNTQYESLNVQAEPALSFTLSNTFDLGEMFCPYYDCFVTGLELAVAYQQRSYSRTKVSATTVIPGLIPASDPLNFTIKTYDSFQPTTITAGAQYDKGSLRLGATMEYQEWSTLEDQFSSDTIKDQAGAEFGDVLIPRLGAEFRLGESLSLLAGFSYRPTALKSTETLDVNLFDTDRYIAGLGLSAKVGKKMFLAHPIQIDLAYQRQELVDRDFTITNSRPGTANNIEVTTGGSVDVFSGSLSLKF
ncbi:MAG: aromatic hydrocarbon degradation protein [Pseudomonadota bacterium]|nr:aromatic hydrocarbon degradation protein [Pseudomonadota bacterium]